jgi:ribosomal protein S18 acetylase RimI-like enzyme
MADTFVDAQTGSSYNFFHSLNLVATLPKETIDTLKQDLFSDAFPGFGTNADSNNVIGECWYATAENDSAHIIAAVWISHQFVAGVNQSVNLMYNVFTHSAHRRRGIMNALLKYVLSQWDQRYSTMPPPLYLLVWTSNTPAITLYSKHGFEILGEMMHFSTLSKKDESALVMVR